MISTDIHKAKIILENDGIIGFPTETVYGLAGNAFSEKAIHSIYQLKKRPFNNPLIVHISGTEKLESIAAEIPAKGRLLADQFWPGPLTMILKKSERISDLVTAGQDTVAVRVPNHPKALELLTQLDFPLVAPSANPYQSISPTSAQHVDGYFGDQLALVLEGGHCSKGLESTIIGFEDEKVIVYRLGAVTIEELEECIGEVYLSGQKDSSVKVPGMDKKHYAPQTQVIVSNAIVELVEQFETKRIGLICFDKLPIINASEGSVIHSFNGDLNDAAKRLYGLLHELDELKLACILIEEFPARGLGKTINDRIKRASVTK